jgi:hypothetical protein
VHLCEGISESAIPTHRIDSLAVQDLHEGRQLTDKVRGSINDKVRDPLSKTSRRCFRSGWGAMGCFRSGSGIWCRDLAVELEMLAACCG